LYPIMDWAFEALLILCIAVFVRTKRQVWILWMALFLSLLVVDFRQFYLVAHGAVRAGGFFKDIPTISIIYGLLVPPLAVLSVDMELGKRERNVFWGMLALGLMGAYATGARGVWLAILMAIAVIFACRGGWKRLLRCMAACILCFLVIALVASPQTRDRVAPERLGRDNSIMARFALYDAATEMFFEHPFLGVGMQQFNVHWREKCPSDKPNWQKLVNAHNTCLMYLSEGGLVGFGGYITFVGYLLWWAWKRRDTRWGLQLFGTVFSAFVQGMTGNEFGMHQAIRVYWMIIGLSFAAEAIVLEEGQTGETSDKNPVDR
ncbi:MAG: O-antigen ligase family protein, partial [Schwartzia sp.]|nr:O-antigen ligase family protein [Schwartzia sp. (in: firmicutes)]